nr:immunoglobulin heavy chain junction region [Mus musculus]
CARWGTYDVDFDYW